MAPVLIALPLWATIHRWTSLWCTLSMFLLGLTGLPLIFHREIDHALGNTVEVPTLHDSTAGARLDRVADTAYRRHPGLVVRFASRGFDEDRIWTVTMGPTPTSDDLVQVAVDARDAALLGEPVIGGKDVMSVIRSLHVDLFAGLAGKLFLGAMGMLLLGSIASGVVLFAPFMRKLSFGTVRHDRAPRLRWLDLHNLIGTATLTWVAVVGTTGVVNTGADLLLDHWKSHEMAGTPTAYAGRSPIDGRPRARQARAGRRADLARHRQPRPAVVPDHVAGLAAAALRRLRRPAAEGPLGPARRRNAGRARQRALPLGGTTAQTAARAEGRLRHRSGGRVMSDRRANPRLWTAPLLLGSLTIFGLASALLGDGVWDLLSWITPLLVCVVFAIRRPRTVKDDSRRQAG